MQRNLAFVLFLNIIQLSCLGHSHPLSAKETKDVPLVVLVNPDINDYLPEVKAAMELFNSEIGCTVFEYWKSGNYDVLVKKGTSKTTPNTLAFTDISANFTYIEFFRDLAGGDIKWNDYATSRTLTFMHELGHSVGLDHSRSTDSIMYPDLDVIRQTANIPESDRVMLRKRFCN